MPTKLIGTAPYQVPRNSDLGTLAFQDNKFPTIDDGIKLGNVKIHSNSNNIDLQLPQVGGTLVSTDNWNTLWFGALQYVNQYSILGRANAGFGELHEIFPNDVVTIINQSTSTINAARLSLPSGQTAGSTTAGYLQYNGTTKTAGQLDGGVTAPTNTTRLNYDGYLYATRFYGDGSQLTGIISGATLSAVSASTTYYIGLSPGSTGAWTDGRVDVSNLYYSSGNQTLYCTNFNTSSDIRLKKNVATIDSALNTIQALRGVEFTWKKNGLKTYGVIAQEIEQVIPELVSDINNTKSVNYNAIIGFLIQAVKELSDKVEKLENGIL